MASSCMKGLYENDRFIVHQDADCWSSKLIQCVGVDYILEVFLGTQVLEDLKLLKDCKPASVSNWSFDENCHFCCLRREKVKKHVAALNKQIVQSGGKPLLGQDPSNVSRLEWQSEEFLNSVFQRKEYTPRIPDPHIPVVACDIVQQMINRLATFYTSRNCSQVSLQNNDKKDQSLLKSSCVAASAVFDTAASVSSQNLASNKFIMVDQNAPLDLSVKKVKAEVFEQDGVLDLSTKKNCKGQMSVMNSYALVNPAAHLVKRDSVGLSLARARDLQSASTLEQFMSKLCLHHQHQIVDALGFLQNEVKSASSHLEAPAQSFSEIQATTTRSRLSYEARSEIQWSERTSSVDAAVTIARAEKTSFVRTIKKDNREDLSADICSIAPEKPMDLCKVVVGGLSSSSCRTGGECGNVSNSHKSQSLFTMKKTAIELRSSFQKVASDNAERCLQAYTEQSDHTDLYPKTTEKYCLLQNTEAVIKTSTVQRTSNGVLPTSLPTRKARKSRKGSLLLQKNGSSGYILNDPDSHCDLVYIRKSITECQPQSHNQLHPRINARKSTRGHKYVEEYLELKTVRTLARKSVIDANRNCPAHMPDVHTSVTPKQSFSKLDGVPLISTPFAGDCVKDVVQRLSSDQMAENEIPDVVKVASQGLIVKTSQAGKIESNDQIPHELVSEQNEFSMKHNLVIEVLSCAPKTVKTHNTHAETHKDVVEVRENTEEELAEQLDGCDSQIGPVSKEVVCGLESKPEHWDKSVETSQSQFSPSIAKDDSTSSFNVQPRNDFLKVNIMPDDQKQSDTMEIINNKSTQVQVLHDTEINQEMVDGFKLPDKNQGNLGGSSLKDVPTVQSNVKCEKMELALHTQKDLQAKMIIVKHAVSSERCLRSRVSKGSVVTEDFKCGAELVDLKIGCANDESVETPLVKQPLVSIETNVNSEGEPHVNASEILETVQELLGAKPSDSLVDNYTVKTRLKQKSTLATVVTKKEYQGPNLKLSNDKLPSAMLSDIASVTSTAKSGKPHKLKKPNSEKIQNKNRSHIELSIDKGDLSIKKSSSSWKSMILRSRSNIERPLGSKIRNLTHGGNLEKEGLMTSKRNSCTSEQATDLVALSPMSVMRIPLRSKTSSTVKQTKDPPVKSSIKFSNSSYIREQPINSCSSTTYGKSEPSGHMPLRCGTGSAVPEDTLVSPGRMPLRRGNLSTTEKPCGSATPPSRNKHSLRQQRILVSSGVKGSLFSSKIKIEKNMEEPINSSNLSKDMLCGAIHVRTEPVVCNPPKFLETLKGKEHQQLISNLNAKFEKMHKGWVQMDKEAQPAPKPKNKADRLKEIWKSKRRIRKSRPLEQQKFSPVQMLFMKPFDLPSICTWFLQSTETKSLVIVKKINTRLPSESQLCFHTTAAGTGASNGIFPSLQAERLKKHLKKFAVASPVKNNPKNQRLISKALGRDISVMRSKEKLEPKAATRMCTKVQSLAGVTPTQTPESLCTVAGSLKTPACVRILRKYSNMRGKIQQSKKCEKTFRSTRFKTSIITKKAGKQKLPAHKRSDSAQSIKSLTKKAKSNSPAKERTLKNNQCHKNGTSPKRLQTLTKVTKANVEHASTNVSNKKVLTKTRIDKAQQGKGSGPKVGTKKSVLNKGPNRLELQSLDMGVKPLSLEDQVLTRSQRKMESTPSQNGSKFPTKRRLGPLITPSKRKRTSKP